MAAGVGILLLVLLLIRSFLSIILFRAALATFSGDPAGRSGHRFWAWGTIIFDALTLLLTGGLDPSAWWGLIYAALILMVMNQPDVLAYYGKVPYPVEPSKPRGYLDDGI